MCLRTTCSNRLLPGMLDYQTALFKDIRGILQVGYSVVLDRSWPSEHVYAPIFRPQHENFLVQVKTMAEQFAPHYVFIEREDVVEAHAANKDRAHPYTKRQFAKVVKGYKELAAEMKGDFFLGPRTHIVQYNDIILDGGLISLMTELGYHTN